MLQWLAHFEFGATCLPQFAGSDGHGPHAHGALASGAGMFFADLCEAAACGVAQIFVVPDPLTGHGVFMAEFSGKSGRSQVSHDIS